MNRLSPLIVRRVGPFAEPAIEVAFSQASSPMPGIAADLRLFATIWIGGMVFFTTFLS